LNKELRKKVMTLFHKYDSIEDDFIKLLNLFELFTPKKIQIGIDKNGRKLWAENDRTYKGTVFDLLAINDVSNSVYEGTLESWTRENIALIKGVNVQQINTLETELLRAMRMGTRAKDFEEVLREELEYSERRIKLIARDQILKFSGQIDRLKQTEIGITKYIWRTSGDERVRRTHEQNANKTFSWDNPPETGHPGQDYQCRCRAEPDISAFLE
jgi:SPP1 gp7 family putative phage head morphogenesis protein